MSQPALDDVLGLPDHLRDALWRVESARIAPVEAGGVMLCGGDTDRVGCDLAAAALAGRGDGWPVSRCADPGDVASISGQLMLCASYSGGDEDVLDSLHVAVSAGARVIAATTGGQLADRARELAAPVIGLPGLLSTPRAATGYVFVAGVEVAALGGVAPRIADEIEAAADFLKTSRDELIERAANLARELGGSRIEVFGEGLMAPVARRWRDPIVELSPGPGSVAVFLDDGAGSQNGGPAGNRSPALTGEGSDVIRVEVKGETPTELGLYGVMLGDLVSLELAG